jgi:hypothetical protein
MPSVCTTSNSTSVAAAEEKPAEVTLLPANPEAVAERRRALSEAGPRGARLVAYLDCGSQRQSAAADPVKITWIPGQVYQFRSEAPGVGPTQSSVFFDAAQVVFDLDGLDRAKHYLAGLTWWDYDDGGRTQSVVAGSPDGRLVRLAVSAIRLPNYTSDAQPPDERRFHLPVVFARDGRMRLSVEQVTGANVVISELWIWQLD